MQPTISVVIATFNSAKTIASCLASIREQKYPQKKIEIILADGGSTDATKQIAKKFNTKIISIPKSKQNAEYNKGIGVNAAKGLYILIIDHDNILPHKNWLTKMLLPMKIKNMIGVETLYINYNKNASVLDRYLALFGSLDPIAHYLGKVDKLQQFEKKYNLLGKSVDKGAFFKVKFEPDYVPAIGSNGFLVRKDILLKHAQAAPETFFHTDVCVDLIRKGFDTYAFIKDDIIHETGYKSVIGFLKRRKMFMEQYGLKNKKRRHSIYLPQDTFKLILFIFFTITFVKPTYDALRGYIKIRDAAWFLHPILCFLFLVIYGYVVLKGLFVNGNKTI